ncbi:uncharacterized protein [Dermacentor andersoni]|uniref:uncharacterized protein n=1 Tax=Dermacentor andersoni TaxID=34620 RepID=UPI003B3AB838
MSLAPNDFRNRMSSRNSFGFPLRSECVLSTPELLQNTTERLQIESRTRKEIISFKCFNELVTLKRQNMYGRWSQNVILSSSAASGLRSLPPTLCSSAILQAVDRRLVSFQQASGTAGRAMAAGRAHWSQSETFTLIRIWEDNLSDLRRAKRNQKVYAHMVEELFKAGVEKSVKETKTKIENLGNKYSVALLYFCCRDINKKKGTGCGQITWPFYWDIHKFLQALPINDDSLLHDSVCNSSSTVEQVSAMHIVQYFLINFCNSYVFKRVQVYVYEIIGTVSRKHLGNNELHFYCILFFFQLITSMEHGKDFGSDEDASVGDAALVDAEALLSTQGSASENPSPLVSDSEGSQAPTPPAARKRADRQALKKRQPSQQLLLTQVVEEQRQLRLSLEKSKEKELSMRERQLRLDEAAAEREERLITVLEKLVGK